jgi:hypothetical protein
MDGNMILRGRWSLIEKIFNELRKAQRPGMLELMEWLEKSDFFTAPASTKYHCSYEGGLAEHSWNTYQVFCHKNKIYKLGLPEDTLIICGLLHDVCKIAFYKKGSRNVKENGQWVAKEVWEVEDKEPLGHGEKSVIILMDFIKLTDFEKYAIRWHMGFSEGTNYSLSTALDLMPGIVTLHTADMESSYILEGRKENNE